MQKVRRQIQHGNPAVEDELVEKAFGPFALRQRGARAQLSDSIHFGALVKIHATSQKNDSSSNHQKPTDQIQSMNQRVSAG